MKCLTDMSHQRKNIQDKLNDDNNGFTLQELKEVLYNYEIQFNKRQIEIAAGHTPQSLKGKSMENHVVARQLSPVLATSENTYTPIAAANDSNHGNILPMSGDGPDIDQSINNQESELDTTPRTPFRLEPSATGYSPEILNMVDVNDVEKINIAGRGSNLSSNGHSDDYDTADLEIVHKGGITTTLKKNGDYYDNTNIKQQVNLHALQQMNLLRLY